MHAVMTDGVREWWMNKFSKMPSQGARHTCICTFLYSYFACPQSSSVSSSVCWNLKLKYRMYLDRLLHIASDPLCNIQFVGTGHLYTQSADSYIALLQEVAPTHGPNQQKHRSQTSQTLQGWIRLQDAAAFVRLSLTEWVCVCVCVVYLHHTAWQSVLI